MQLNSSPRRKATRLNTGRLYPISRWCNIGGVQLESTILQFVLHNSVNVLVGCTMCASISMLLKYEYYPMHSARQWTITSRFDYLSLARHRPRSSLRLGLLLTVISMLLVTSCGPYSSSVSNTSSVSAEPAENVSPVLASDSNSVSNSRAVRAIQLELFVTWVVNWVDGWSPTSAFGRPVSEDRHRPCLSP